jgi:DNA invertase Pin-like site-specific DNA recombinase
MISSDDHRILPEHLGRDAVIYPRQSSHKQVLAHSESTRIQLGLREKAVTLGWPNPVVIEEDLGISASGFAERPGFQKMLTRVTMRQVGIILCLDASRLSRNSKDWAQLFELCAYFNTLIADLDQIYDLSRPNDRLVLGIKGTVAEMELGVLRTRMRAGMEAKAARGELRFNLPSGYEYDPSGKIAFHPDKRVQAAIHTMFRQFDRFTSIRQLAIWYRDTNTLFPVKELNRDAKTIWQVPTPKTLNKLLVHPIYAGAYVYGRRSTRVDCLNGKLVKRVQEGRPLEECRVCIRDHHPGYISWDKLLANRAKIFENRPRWSVRQNRGAIREGLALLAGLLRCATCGGKLCVGYKKESALYYCDGGHVKGSRRCLSFGCKRMDQQVSEELCRALEPFAVKAAIAAVDMQRTQKLQEIENATIQLQAAQYAADRAFEQFDLCDPKNRLVADTLEERLNARLADVATAKRRLENLSANNDALSEGDRRRLLELAEDFPSLWNHPDADPILRKRLLRCAIHEILVKHEPAQQRLEVTIHWQGGVHTRLHVKKCARPTRHSADSPLVELVRELSSEVVDGEIARILNMMQMTTPKGLRWTQDRVRELRSRHRIRLGQRPKKADHLTMNQAADYLGISKNGLLALVRIGVISKNQITDFAPWRVSREQLDSEEVQNLVHVLKTTGKLPKGGSPKDQQNLFDCES